MRILGLSALYHDSAAALIDDGAIVAAAQEERFTRRKHDPSLPHAAAAYCLDQAGCSFRDVDFVAFYDKPLMKFERILETYLAFAPRGFSSFANAIPNWVGGKLSTKSMLRDCFQDLAPGFDWDNRLLFSEHHLSHAASAFYPSPFEEAIVLTIDGVGEWTTTSAAIGTGSRLEVLKEIHFPHSLGMLYSAFTQYLGFKVNSGEYKVMGLAPYGEPRFADKILSNLIDVRADGSFRLDMAYFDYCTGKTMINDRFAALFGEPARRGESLLQPFHMDVAASIQAVAEEVVLKLAAGLRRQYGLPNLCLAGGVALNCVANGKIHRAGLYEDIWIQPAAGDAGGALGAALAAHHISQKNPRHPRRGGDDMRGSYLGPAFLQPDIESRLSGAGAVFSVLDDDQLIDATAAKLADNQAVGWMQGRMEFGPRALGGRSILGNPRSPEMQKTLNLKVKFRESFRPFAPAVLAEDVSEWFEHDGDSPYMLLVAAIEKSKQIPMTAEEQQLFGIDKLNRTRSEIPAVTHVDYSARLQTVHAETNPRFHALLTAFKEKTGCPVLVNTSFNVRGEPIVCTPEDAFRCFMGTELDFLVVGNCVLEKKNQDPALKQDYTDTFDLD